MATSSSDDDTLFQSHYNPSPSSSSSSSPSPPLTANPISTTYPSQTHLPHNFFAPPFYNRPPTPLPPSPSLTSLLRPSRPTTPDSSDNDHSLGNSNAPRRHLPVPRASPKVPTYEYYGFVLYLFSSLSFLMYLLWSYLPSPFLHFLGIYYYPNRWWSLAIPAWLVMLLVYIYVALATYNTGSLTLGLGDLGTVVDEAANVAVVDRTGRVRSSFLMGGPLKEGERQVGGRKGYARKERREGRGRKARDWGNGGDRQWDWKQVWSEGTDAVMDVPLGGVCEVLYGDGRDEESDGDECEDNI